MKKLIGLYAVGIVSVISAGCTSNIGQENFSCDTDDPRNGVCAGPRAIYELTNDRENLENLHEEPEHAHLFPPAKTRPDNPRRTLPEGGRTAAPQSEKEQVAKQTSERQGVDTVYEARDEKQQHPDNYQQAEAIPQQPQDHQGRDSHKGWPSSSEPMAPEPMAVMERPVMMRVMVAPWKDREGNLNVPGYIYAEVTPRKFNFGSAASMRPSRVVPFQMRESTQEQQQRQQYRSQGVDGLGISSPFGQQQDDQE